MRTFSIVALAALISTAAMAQAPAGTTPRTPQEANGATSGGTPAAEAERKTDAKKSMGSSGMAMDANGDGMISQQEYMDHHTKMWGGMKMTRNGMISLADMQAQMKGGPN